MPETVNYYEILGIPRTAEKKDIETAFKRLSLEFHPDRQTGATEGVKRLASQHLQTILLARNTLENPSERSAYDLALTRRNRPIPRVDKNKIRIKNAAPGRIHRASFTVYNDGGEYSNIHISDPDSWLKVAEWKSWSKDSDLPMTVTLEAVCAEGGRHFQEEIEIRLDDESILLKVEFSTKKVSSAKTPSGKPLWDSYIVKNLWLVVPNSVLAVAILMMTAPFRLPSLLSDWLALGIFSIPLCVAVFSIVFTIDGCTKPSSMRIFSLGTGAVMGMGCVGPAAFARVAHALSLFQMSMGLMIVLAITAWIACSAVMTLLGFYFGNYFVNRFRKYELQRTGKVW